MEQLIRHWDPKKQFEGAVLKVYEHWVLEVSWQQHTLGNFIIFCRREGVRLQSQLEDIESVELKKVMDYIERALRWSDAFRPHHFNYLQMGNALPLLHFHGIPRYKKSRPFSKELLGREVTDPNWGHSPPWTREKISEEQMKRLQPLMEEAVSIKRPNMAVEENPLYPGIREAIATR